MGDPFPALFFWKLTFSKSEGILWLFLRPEQKERRAVWVSVFAYASRNIWTYNKQDWVTYILKKSKWLVHLFLKPWKAGLSFFPFFFLKGLQQAETMETCIIKIDNHNNALKSTGRGSDDWKAKEIISSQGQTGFLKGFQLVEKK